MLRSLRVLALILTLFSSGGCGQMGPLYMPDQEPITAPPDTPAPTQMPESQPV
ncbi:MAG: hypothetical protein AAGA91_05285 [Pseudomonadota bacterium]